MHGNSSVRMAENFPPMPLLALPGSMEGIVYGWPTIRPELQAIAQMDEHIGLISQLTRLYLGLCLDHGRWEFSNSSR